MKNIKILDLLSEAISALNSIVEMVSVPFDDERECTLENPAYLSVSTTTTVVRGLYGELDERIQSKMDCTKAIDNLYIHMYTADKVTNIVPLREHVQAIHSAVYEVLFVARETLDLYNK